MRRAVLSFLVYMYDICLSITQLICLKLKQIYIMSKNTIKQSSSDFESFLHSGAINYHSWCIKHKPP